MILINLFFELQRNNIWSLFTKKKNNSFVKQKYKIKFVVLNLSVYFFIIYAFNFYSNLDYQITWLMMQQNLKYEYDDFNIK